MRQPVIAKVLESAEIAIVRSRMPGSAAGLMCVAAVEHEVLVDLVGEHDQIAALRDLGQLRELGAREDLAAGIDGRVDHQRARARSDRALERAASKLQSGGESGTSRAVRSSAASVLRW